MLKGTLTAFYAVKHLYATFEAETLGHLNEKTLVASRLAFQIGTPSL